MARMKDGFVVQRAVRGTDSWQDIGFGFIDDTAAKSWIMAECSPDDERFRIIDIHGGSLCIHIEETRTLEEVEE